MTARQTIYKIKSKDNFVIINRHLIENPQLSYEARGLLACMLAKPKDWVIYSSYFIKNSPAGRDKVRRIFNELIKFGYLVKSEHRSEKGHYSSPQYTVHESPISSGSDVKIVPKPENPSTDNPLAEKPSPLNPPLLSKHLKPIKQVTKNTTTKSDNHIWSPKLSDEHRNSIITLMNEVDDHDAVQLLLDELSGQIENIKNPVGYFRILLHSYLLGDFTPAKAIQIQASRKRKYQNDFAVERSLKYHDEQLDLKIKKYMQK